MTRHDGPHPLAQHMREAAMEAATAALCEWFNGDHPDDADLAEMRLAATHVVPVTLRRGIEAVERDGSRVVVLPPDAALRIEAVVARSPVRAVHERAYDIARVVLAALERSTE